MLAEQPCGVTVRNENGSSEPISHPRAPVDSSAVVGLSMAKARTRSRSMRLGGTPPTTRTRSGKGQGFADLPIPGISPTLHADNAPRRGLPVPFRPTEDHGTTSERARSGAGAKPGTLLTRQKGQCSRCNCLRRPLPWLGLLNRTAAGFRVAYQFVLRVDHRTPSMSQASLRHVRSTLAHAVFLVSASMLTTHAMANDCDGDGRSDCFEIAAGAADANDNGVVDSCEKARGDFNLDGGVWADDLTVILNAWGPGKGPADLDGNRVVDGVDLVMALGNWGQTPTTGRSCSDGNAWAESIDGPLSGNMAAPTVVFFQVGANRIIGTSTPAPGGQCAIFPGSPPAGVSYYPNHESYTDLVTFTLSANQRLIAIQLEVLEVTGVYTTEILPCVPALEFQRGAFTAINNSNQIDWNSDSVVNFLALPTQHPLIGLGFAKSQGEDLLAKYREPFPIPAYNLNSPKLEVSDGTFTFWWKEGANQVSYTINFIVEEVE